MRQRISTILCVILLALQIGALVKAEEERTVSGNEQTEESAEASGEEEMLGSGRVFSLSDIKDADIVEITDPVDDDLTVSGNDADVSDDAEVKNPADDGDLLADESDLQVSENDLAVSDNDTTVSDNDSEVSDNDPEVSGNDPDGILDGDDALDEISGSEDIIIVDGKPMVDTDGDGLPDKELDAVEAEKLLETISEDDPAETVSADDPAETVSGDEPEKAVDYAAGNILSLQIPRNLDFIIDPWEIGEKGSVWSAEHVFSNHGTEPVKLTLKNIKCKVREGITCLGQQYGADAASKASGKAAWLQLVLDNGDVIYLTEDGSSYETVIDAGESVSMTVKGAVSNPRTEQWQDGDISVSLTYGVAACGEREK